MSLSKHLQTSGLLSVIRGMPPQQLEERVIALGDAWYREHPEERDTIARNLEAFGLDASASTIDGIERHTILHYFEKFLPLTDDIASYAAFLEEHVDGAEGISLLEASLAARRGVCIATAHFGAVEFIVPFLALHKLPMNVVIRFTTEQLSVGAHEQAIAMEKSGRFSLINLIEIGRPKTVAAMQMAAALRRGEIAFSVFDEKTPYSKPADLFGTKVWGGAGLDRMIDFANTQTDLYAAFMLREEGKRYRLELRRIGETGGGRIDAIYRTLQEAVTRNLTQWYFLHEEIPFVEEGIRL
ncbi:MAG: hypothetical protein JW913_17305 [Chitinispirillaceae bacterium]|nr:hypothetical protein [Chitinispirillaceae bacterium]